MDPKETETLKTTEWPPSKEGEDTISDDDMIVVGQALAQALPDDHRKLANQIIEYMKAELKTPGSFKPIIELPTTKQGNGNVGELPGDPTPVAAGGSKRRMRGGDVSFYIKCMFLALIEVIVDAASGTPQIVLQGAGIAVVATTLISQHTGAVGTAAAATLFTKKVLDIYYSIVLGRLATEGVEARTAAAAAEEVDVSSRPPLFVPLTPRSTGPTGLVGPVGAPMTNEDAWMAEVAANPGIAGTIQKGPSGTYRIEDVKRVMLAVLIAVYLKKLYEVIARERTRNVEQRILSLQLAALEAPPAAQVVVRQPRRRSVGRVAAAVVQQIADAPPAPALGGRRRTRRRHRHRRHRPSAPTRKVPSSSRRSRPTGRRRG